MIKKFFKFFKQKFKLELKSIYCYNNKYFKLNFKNFKIKIPIPSIEIQNQIVEELDGYQKIIDGCRQVIENYKPSIDIDPSCETKFKSRYFNYTKWFNT